MPRNLAQRSRRLSSNALQEGKRQDPERRDPPGRAGHHPGPLGHEMAPLVSLSLLLNSIPFHPLTLP